MKECYYTLDIICAAINECEIRLLLTKMINRDEILLKNIDIKGNGEFKNIIVFLVTNSRYNHVVEQLITRLIENTKVLSLNINRAEERQNILDDDE